MALATCGRGWLATLTPYASMEIAVCQVIVLIRISFERSLTPWMTRGVRARDGVKGRHSPVRAKMCGEARVKVVGASVKREA